jgi:hypothetical protein
MGRSINSLNGPLDEKVDFETVESLPVPDVLLERYSLIKDKPQEELDVLNKKVLRKLDWKFLPCITMMLLMKSVRLFQSGDNDH